MGSSKIYAEPIDAPGELFDDETSICTLIATMRPYRKEIESITHNSDNVGVIPAGKGTDWELEVEDASDANKLQMLFLTRPNETFRLVLGGELTFDCRLGRPNSSYTRWDAQVTPRA